jgi:hypothetical protein
MLDSWIARVVVVRVSADREVMQRLRIKNAAATRSSVGPRRGSTRLFVRHYVQMVLVMLAGMALLFPPTEGVLRVMGSGTVDLQRDAPAAALLGMALGMSASMMAWMRLRGHAWRPSLEMVVAMTAPGLGVVALLASSLVEEFDVLLMVEHVVMLLSMLAVMLLRRDEYARHVHRPRRRERAA